LRSEVSDCHAEPHISDHSVGFVGKKVTLTTYTQKRKRTIKLAYVVL
jgi:hypothetical protein